MEKYIVPKNSILRSFEPTPRRELSIPDYLGKSDLVITEFVSLCRRLGIIVRTLYCSTTGVSIPIGICGNATKNGSRLILAGIHGDEPAGVLGTLEFLRRWNNNYGYISRNIDSPAIVFAPLVSPTAFHKSTRTNVWNENANRGYFSVEQTEHEIAAYPSKEGEVLLSNLSTLSLFASQGVLSLHEDRDMTEFYLYAYEHASRPSQFTNGVREIGEKYFDVVKDDQDFAEGPVKNGIIFNDKPVGALDELLFFSGSPNVFVTETPAKGTLLPRIEATVDLIKFFITYPRL